MKSLASTVLWTGVYLTVVLTPLFALLIGPSLPGSGFWWDFSMALGFAGMSMMGVQFFLTARFRRATAPFGIDIIYYFHRYMALLLFAVIMGHYFIIRLTRPSMLGSLDPLQTPFYMTAGRVALLCIVLLIITSLWRKHLRIHYEEWRIAHVVLAVSAFVLALVHIEGVSYYTEAAHRRWLWTLYSLLWLLLILNVRVLKPWRLLKQPYRVTGIAPAHGDSWTLSLQADGHAGMTFKPGQFAWMSLHTSPWSMQEHPFSISSSAAHPEQLEFTIKSLGDFTCTLGETQIGDPAYLDGPYGVFSIDRFPRARGFVFIAGGVGAAPILSMLRTLADRQDKRPLWFLYGNSEWQNIIFREELEELKTRLNLTLVHVLDQPPQDWQGERGQITAALLRKYLPATTQDLEYFLCGPKAMSDSVQQSLAAMQIRRSRIHFELFDMV